MTTHQTGALKGNRQGTTPVIHTFPVTYADTTAVAKKLCTIGAADIPKLYRVSAVVKTASNAATSHTLSVGVTGAGYTDILNAVDIKSAAGTNFVPSALIKIATTDVDVYAIPTIVGAVTAGEVIISIEMWEYNSTEPTALNG